jgi:hypothetical protein
MRALADTLLDPLPGNGGKPQTIQCNLKGRLGVFPLAPGADTGDIIAFAASGRSRIGCAIEKSVASSAPEDWITIAQDGGLSPSLTIPRAQGCKYRLKIWSENNTEEKISLSYSLSTARSVYWKEAADGLTGLPEQLGGEYRAWFKIDLGSNAPGNFHIVSEPNALSGIGATTSFDSVFTNESSSWFSSSGRTCWIELHFSKPGRFRTVFSPLTLENNKPFVMPLIGNRPRVFETRLSKGSVGFLSVVADGSNPLAGIIAGQGTSARSGISNLAVRGIPVDGSLWIGEGRSAAFSLFTDENRTVVWNAAPPIDGTQPMAGFLWNELPLIDGGAQNSGVAFWNIAYPAARVTHFTKGSPVRLRITLPPKSAAVVIHSDGSRTIECSFDNEPVIKDFFTDGGDLYLLALGNGAKFDITTYRLASNEKSTILDDQSLSAGIDWQVKLARPGTLILPLRCKDNKPLKLFFQGPIRGVGWVGADGMLHAELTNGAPVGPGGFLVVTHTAGWAKMDLCDGAQNCDVIACKWGAPLIPSNAEEITQSSIVKLHDRINWFSIVIRDTQHLNVSSPQPLAAILLSNGTPVNYQEAWEFFNWDLPLPPGNYVLGIHAIAGSSLEGGNLSALFRPIQQLSEKQPFTCRMVPGESRLLSFNVTKKSDFGIGLSTAKETVQARLYNANGFMLEQGKQLFQTLTPGKYYLWLRIPEAAEGTEVTARLFGQEPPPNNPPEQLVKWIINGAVGPRPSGESILNDEHTTDREQSWKRFLHNSYDYSNEPTESESASPEQVNEEPSENQSDTVQEQPTESNDDQAPQEQEPSGSENNGEGD